MKYCADCGSEMPEGADLCPHCGSEQGKTPDAGGKESAVPTEETANSAEEFVSGGTESAERAEAPETPVVPVISSVRPAEGVPVLPVRDAPKKSTAAILIVAAVLLIVFVVCALVTVFGKKPANGGTATSAPAESQVGLPDDTDVYFSSAQSTALPDSSSLSESTPAGSSATGKENGAGSQTAAPASSANKTEQNNSSAPAAVTAAPSGQKNTQPVTAAPKTSSDIFAYFVKTLNSGNYAMSGTMTSGGETMPLGMAFCADASRMSVDIEDIAMDLAIADGKTYLINNKNKTYMILSEALAQSMGIDPSDMDMSQAKWTVADASTAVKSQAQLDGKTVDCFTVGSGSGTMKVYISGLDIIRFDKYDSSGKVNAIYRLTSFKGSTTMEDILPGSDYTEKNFMSFFTALM